MNLPPETGSGCERCAQTAKKAAPEKQEAAKNWPRSGRGSQLMVMLDGTEHNDAYYGRTLSAELVAHHAGQLEQRAAEPKRGRSSPARL